MMLQHPHDIKVIFLCFHYLAYFIFSDAFFNYLLSHHFLGSVEVGTGVSCFLLFRWSACKVPSPEIFRVITIWEAVVILGSPLDIVFPERIQILTWSGIHESDIDLVVLVQKLDDSIHLVEVQFGVGECEVTAPWQKQMSLLMIVMISLYLHIINQLISFFDGVESGHGSVTYKRLICIVSLVDKESWWEAIVILKCIYKDLVGITEMLGEWSPEVVQRVIVFESLISVAHI